MLAMLAQYAKKIGSTVKTEADKIGFRWHVTLVVATAAILLLLPSYHSGRWFLEALRLAGGDDFARQADALGFNHRLFFDVALPVGLIAAIGHRLRDYGLGLGKLKTGLALSLVFCAVYVPCFFVLFSNPGFQEYYGGIAKQYATWRQFLGREIVFVTVLSVRTEFLFRGFILFGVKREYGAYAGILAQAIPYVLVHAGKAEIEAIGSLPVGLALAWLAVKTNSIWYGVFLHASIALLFNVLIFALNR